MRIGGAGWCVSTKPSGIPSIVLTGFDALSRVPAGGSEGPEGTGGVTIAKIEVASPSVSQNPPKEAGGTLRARPPVRLVVVDPSPPLVAVSVALWVGPSSPLE